MELPLAQSESETTERWYRFENYLVSAGVDEFDRDLGTRVELRKRVFEVDHHTPKGVWLLEWGSKRFVRKGARKQFACPTEKEAIESFLARKARQIRILKNQIEHVQSAVWKAESIHRTLVQHGEEIR